jgi:hypothetical protein
MQVDDKTPAELLDEIRKNVAALLVVAEDAGDRYTQYWLQATLPALTNASRGRIFKTPNPENNG